MSQRALICCQVTFTAEADDAELNEIADTLRAEVERATEHVREHHAGLGVPGISSWLEPELRPSA